MKLSQLVAPSNAEEATEADRLIKQALEDSIREQNQMLGYDPSKISLCPQCGYMTHTLFNGTCDKCKEKK